ncbi:transcription factor Ouib-like isoform X1 [Drosophila virilis]
MSVAFICRTCGKQIDRLHAKNLFADKGDEILKKIQALTGIWLTDELDMPGKICAYCLLDLEHAIAFRERCIKTNTMLMRQNLERKQIDKKTSCPFVNDSDPLSNDKSGLIELEAGEELNCDATGSAYAQRSPQIPPRISRASIPKAVPDIHCKITSHIPARKYFCRQCGMYFDDKSNLSRHRQRHLNETTYEENMFQTAFDLAETVFDNEQSSLPIVPASHNSYRGLQSSSQTHETIKPSKAKKSGASGSQEESSPNKRIRRLGNYFCDQCGRHFNDKANLNRHLQRHMGVKKFECPECGHKDYTQHLINLHQRIQHQGEKPYACKYCGERFANSMARLRHQRSHMEYLESSAEAPAFTCKLCNKSFRKKSILDTHAVVHTGEQPFCCDICNVYFNRKSSLRAHYRSKFHQTNATLKLDKTGVESD